MNIHLILFLPSTFEARVASEPAPDAAADAPLTSAPAPSPKRENPRPRVDWTFLQRHTFETDVPARRGLQTPAAVCQGGKLDRGGGRKATEAALSVLSP